MTSMGWCSRCYDNEPHETMVWCQACAGHWCQRCGLARSTSVESASVEGGAVSSSAFDGWQDPAGHRFSDSAVAWAVRLRRRSSAAMAAPAQEKIVVPVRPLQPLWRRG